jgi:hemolysin activation/secretion protein
MKEAPKAGARILACSLLAWGLAAGSRLRGQTYRQVAPRAVREAGPTAPAEAAPAPEAPVANPDQVLVPRLNGLRLVASPDAVKREPAAAGRPVAIDGLPWLDRRRTEAVAREFLGRPLRRKDLSRLAQALVQVCRRSGRPVVDIYAPPQDVSAGVVQLVVLVAKLGQVRVEGERWFAPGLLAREIRLRPGQDIDGPTLFEDVDRLNQNPFRQVDLVYARGRQAGQTDVILRVHDARPERVYAGYDDSGNEATGLGRVFLGVNLGNLWRDDQQLSYQYSRSTDFGRMQAHSASTTLPLPWGHTLELFGDWAEARVQSGGIIDLTGTAWEVGARYLIPLPLLGSSVSQSLQIGAECKSSNNNLAFGGTQVFASPASMAEGVLGYSLAADDAGGSTQLSVTGFGSPGGLGGLNHDRDFAVQREGARTEYGYVQLNLTRLERLPGGFSAALAVAGQWSSARLLPSDQFGLGGALSVRGYDERIVNGDDGLSAQAELRTPSRRLLRPVAAEVQALVFVDAGRDWERDPLPGETDTTLASAGPGLRLSAGSHASIKADYGWQLERLPGTRRGRLHLSAVVSF